MGETTLNRDVLIAAILEFLGGDDLLTRRDIREVLEREVDEAGAAAVLALKERLTTEHGWEYYPRDPLAQRLHHLLADRFLEPDSGVLDAEVLRGVAGAPVAIFSNHLSYADANVVEVLFQRAGMDDMANRLTAIAGPKVFTSRSRRFSSLCFGTVKVPQSAEVSSEEAVLSARDVAKAARRSIDVARDRLRAGDALLLFGEGTRSRTAEMQPMLAAVARYLAVPDAWVLPAGLTGSETLYPVGGRGLQPARVTLRLGPPMRADNLLALADGDRHVVMDAIGLAVAALLPASYRGVYANAGDYPVARAVLDRVGGSTAANKGAAEVSN